MAAMQLGALFVAAALAFLGNGLQSTVTSLRASLENMGDAVIGLIMSAFFVGFVIGSVLAPRLIHRVGHIRAFAALASITSGAALMFPLVISPFVWIVLRLVAGACFAGMVIVVESWLNSRAEQRQRGRVMAAYGVILYAAWAGSQLLLRLSPAEGFVLFCLVSIAFSFALVPVTLTRADSPGVVHADRSSLRRLMAISPAAVVGAGILGLSMGAFWGMAPRYGESIGLDQATLSTFLTSVLVGALVLQWPLGWLSDLVDRRLVIAGGAVLGAMASLGLAFTGATSEMAFVGLGFALGGLVMPLYSVCVAHANDNVDADEVVAASSGLILVYGVGSVAGPFLASLLMLWLSQAWLFVLIAVCLVGAAAYTVLRILRTAPPPEAEKFGYVSVPQTSHQVLAMHRHGKGSPEGKRAPR